MSKVISTILNLKDNMSGGLIKAARNTKGVSKEMVSATRNVVAMKNKAVSSISAVVSKTVKWGAVTAGAVAALAAKTGFSEAMNLEGYKLQLETATKDTKKAAEIMKYAIDLANKTPFEGGELVEGAAKFEAMGMSAQTWLSKAGDMAAATNKGFDQAVEALIDAQSGELERLKEFGITKTKILEQGRKMFAGVQIANNKGQIVNQKKFNEAMISLMEDRFAGGMEKQATTVKGLWSTVTGVTKSGLATIMGMSSDGSIKAGSALDLVKQKIQLLADKVQQWQQDGTIDRIAQQFTDGLGRVMDAAKQAKTWITEHSDTIKRVLIGVGAALAAVKILTFVSETITAVSTIAKFVGTVSAVLAAQPIVLGIAAAIVGIGLLIANFDKVKSFLVGLKDTWDGFWSAWGDYWETNIAEMKEGIGSFLGWLDDKISSIPVVGSIYSGIKSVGKSLFSEGSVSGHATGTSYFSGGLTRVNERGGEIMRLPGGTQIIPHDVSARMAGGAPIVVQITVQGNVVGTREFVETMGQTVAQRILAALANT